MRIALLLLALFTGPASAQVGPALGLGGGPGKVAAVSYTGPGDIVSSWYGWYGLRAFNSASRGGTAVNVCNINDAACADLSTDATSGALVTGSIGGAACSVPIVSGTYVSATGAVSLVTGSASGLASTNILAISALTGTGSFVALNGVQTATTGTTGTTVNFTAAIGLGTITISGGTVSVCTVKTAYDKSGNAANITNATILTRPILAINAIGTFPAFAFGSTSFLSGAFSTPTRPYSLSAVNYVSAAQAAAGNVQVSTLFKSPSSSYGEIYMQTNLRGAYDGATATISETASDAAWHTVAAVFNGATSTITVDNVDATGALNTGTIVTPLTLIFGADTIGDAGGGFVGELGYWPGAFTSGNRSSLNTNQKTYWGF